MTFCKEDIKQSTKPKKSPFSRIQNDTYNQSYQRNMKRKNSQKMANHLMMISHNLQKKNKAQRKETKVHISKEESILGNK